MIRQAMRICAVIAAMHTTQVSAELNPVEGLGAFEKLFGVTEGKRRNHTKGFCFSATLIPHDKAILAYTDSPLFSGESTVIGRLSHKGGKSAPADSKPAHYGMSLSISGPSNSLHLMSMNTEDFFPVQTPEEFIELLLAKATSKDAVKTFKAGNADLQRYIAHHSKKPKVLTPYEGTTYNSVNSFYLVAKDGSKTAIRWSFVPAAEQSVVLEPAQDFFYENMQKNLSNQEIVWNMVITIANEDDAVNNAALPWTGAHTQIIAAKLKVTSISTEQAGKCDNINYDPMVVAAGFEPSNDPLLQARRDIYAVAFGKRLGEKQQ